MRAIQLMKLKDDQGLFIYSQYDIQRETGLSRPYLRKLAKEIRHQFARNGIEIKGYVCVCMNCGAFFRRSPSKVIRSKNQFCGEQCKVDWMKGINHASWVDGKTVNTFSKWVQQQADYGRFREEALALADYKCQISGRTDNLDVHHVKPKAQYHDLALDPENALVVCEEVHNRIHSLIREGKDFEEAIELVRKEYE